MTVGRCLPLLLGLRNFSGATSTLNFWSVPIFWAVIQPWCKCCWFSLMGFTFFDSLVEVGVIEWATSFWRSEGTTSPLCLKDLGLHLCIFGENQNWFRILVCWSCYIRSRSVTILRVKHSWLDFFVVFDWRLRKQAFRPKVGNLSIR